MDFIEARELALQLVAVCDIVVENFSPRVMANWNMGFDILKEANPSIILLSMSGMGQTGPYRDFVAYGQTVQALGGLTHMTGTAIDYAYADPISGLYGIVALLAALADRDRTGRGCRIDLSEYEAVCTAIGPELIAAQQHDADSGHTGDGELEMSAFLHDFYPSLIRPEDLLNDPQLRHRNFFRPLPSSNNETKMTDANPILMDGIFKEPWQPSPELGRDNRYVYLELLGMSESQYELYREKGIIA